ncbi:Hypothetical protein POVN_LOCUS350 [uncultured virus]|nr:Hypothetical protein POVN_LOCUS350 [uncultured virus]
MAFSNGAEIARRYGDERIRSYWDYMEDVGPKLIAHLYPEMDLDAINFHDFACFTAGTGLDLGKVVQNPTQFEALFKVFQKLDPDYTCSTMFYFGLVGELSTLPTEEKKLIVHRYAEEQRIFAAFSNLTSAGAVEATQVTSTAIESRYNLSSYLAAKGVTAAEVKNQNFATQKRIVNAAEKVKRENWEDDDAFIHGLMEQTPPALTPVELFSDLNNRLQNLSLDFDTEDAAKLLLWVEQGGLKLLEPSLKAFLKG